MEQSTCHTNKGSDLLREFAGGDAQNAAHAAEKAADVTQKALTRFERPYLFLAANMACRQHARKRRPIEVPPWLAPQVTRITRAH
jgi:hypothetical protein